ncbi:ribbon-helix-helix domain-containing protein [Halovivax cerinus]|uniref:Ribbon-helix-helix domain-containing protein n=1 Tax=Halovivax cerinus TaxID=1487865 RepID=A0ABD5NND8_9EURY|nr:ribbon-helix-helix domain-containing protein [Halovivax cerinus]
MAHSNTTGGDNNEKVNLRLPTDFLADMDERWQEDGYDSRSEFMREGLRDAVYGTRLSRRALEDLAESERQFAEGKTVNAEQARERFGTDSDE